MLKSLFSKKLSVLAFTALSTFFPLHSAQAVTFEETEVNQQAYIAIAQPYGENKYNLIVIEQIPNKNSCWSEGGTNPVNVDILLLNFDFTGHCRRSTDANGYSIRYDGQDYGLEILLNLVDKNGDLTLIGINRTNSSQPPIVVGSARGLNGQPMKIQLNPGWRFTKRTYQGKPLGHVYFSYDSKVGGSAIPSTNNVNPEMTTPTPSPVLPSEIPPQGTIQEIISPDIQPQKEIIKEKDNSVINNQKKEVKVKQSQFYDGNLSQTRFDRMNNR